MGKGEREMTNNRLATAAVLLGGLMLCGLAAWAVVMMGRAW